MQWVLSSPLLPIKFSENSKYSNFNPFWAFCYCNSIANLKLYWGFVWVLTFYHLKFRTFSHVGLHLENPKSRRRSQGLEHHSAVGWDEDYVDVSKNSFWRGGLWYRMSQWPCMLKNSDTSHISLCFHFTWMCVRTLPKELVYFQSTIMMMLLLWKPAFLMLSPWNVSSFFLELSVIKWMMTV